MTTRPHITDDNHHQAETTPRTLAEPGRNYVSPAYRRWAEQVERDARQVDTFTLPSTAAELDALSYADRVRVFTADRALYDRLTGRTPA